MSQMEQQFIEFLCKKPEIEKCYVTGLINRRALARYLIKQGVGNPNQLEAIIAMLRRYDFKKLNEKPLQALKQFRLTIKEQISILEFEKDEEIITRIKEILTHINYNRGDTFKMIMGTTSIKIFIDQKNEDKAKEILKKFKSHNHYKNIVEISLIFPDEAVVTKGILSSITKELTINDIIITELLTNSPELLIYLKEEYVIKAYEILKRESK